MISFLFWNLENKWIPNLSKAVVWLNLSHVQWDALHSTFCLVANNKARKVIVNNIALLKKKKISFFCLVFLLFFSSLYWHFDLPSFCNCCFFVTICNYFQELWIPEPNDVHVILSSLWGPNWLQFVNASYFCHPLPLIKDVTFQLIKDMAFQWHTLY